MANIQITPEILQGKAGELKKLIANHESNMQSIGGLIRGLNEIWKGDAQTAFLTKYESMQSTFNNFREMLEGYATLMDTAAKEFQNTDTALKTAMQSFGS